ncbi:hypothetical protein [Neptunicella marina]|uniref:DUF2306 domain-containing protein n=1 Tax=Neptunicella marina TaxID=2125989 RepID=A0A8J6M3C6_9ALTE|nr:hypothetical protein [Neptunicella marina]MBC3765276.1 hypothetical protein [Neptunicella marina]
MYFTHQFLLYVHVAIGAIALIVFWLPLITRKGSANHKRIGKWYVASMYFVAGTGLVMSSLDMIAPIAIRYPDGYNGDKPIADIIERIRFTALFLWMLSLLVINNVRHSELVIKHKNNPSALRTPTYLLLVLSLLVTSLIVGFIGLQSGRILLQVFAGISLLSAIGALRYMFNKSKNSWLVEHIGAILGSGIGVYTAFFAFGGRALFAHLFSGQAQMIPWLLPSIIGVPCIIWLSNKYRPKTTTTIRTKTMVS